MRASRLVLVAVLTLGVAVVVAPTAAAATPPSITYISPGNGPTLAPGVRVTITGTGFTKATTVDFGRHWASDIVVYSPTELTATTPPHALGRVYVRAHTAAGTSPVTAATYFSYDPYPPVLPDGPPRAVAPGGEAAVTGLSCVSATFCAATTSAGWLSTYDGTRWSHAVRLGMDAVDCTSRTSCAAVSAAGTVTFYDGRGWSVPRVLDHHGALEEVSCVGVALCTAVDDAGYAVRTVDATSWHLPVRISSRGLTSVSCTSASFCMAISSTETAHRWDGSTWRISGYDVGAKDVSCVSPSFCMVNLGYTVRLYVAGVWGRPTGPRDNRAVFDVSCAAAHFCELAGYSTHAPPAVTEDGGVWTQQPVRSGLYQEPYYGLRVSCWSVGHCLLAGQQGSSGGPAVTVSVG